MERTTVAPVRFNKVSDTEQDDGGQDGMTAMDGRPQRALMIEALERAGLGAEDVWRTGLLLGGTTPLAGVRAYLQRRLDLQARESDILAVAVNAILRKRGVDVVVSPLAEDAADLRGDDPGQGLRADTAFLLTAEEQEGQRLAAVRRTGLLDTDQEERFDAITRRAQGRFRTSSVIVTLIDEHRQFLKSAIGPVEQNMPRARSFCNTTIGEPVPVVVPDTFDDPRFRWNPLVLGEPFIRFYAGHPLRSPEGWAVGTLCVIDQEPRVFDADDEADFHSFALEAQHQLDA
ncbi:GAF domain-containing protein [Arthrobacter agilis]|uniref:GAF domain-containing protein n=1 Tax=Arthrobacter agilis TaxID=37921 RepID=UPI000B35AF61|nr:GAF domain-containing protein [Arthrobacter agilis]OUM42209.1 hypothetical protein B8W74_08865 [Arthrobacter agilis]PPB45552.1 GAF domain-containing protein [Arthrobacter agilis]TPV26468.1 GAF domain-containing protein [Arthrobacter agilis]VDR33630.1 Predicted periplasmic ligand-binding sensor domain [Arthrobacter agilis]